MMDLLTSGTIALIMFGIGASLNLAEIKKSLTSPVPIGVGLFFQTICLPVIAAIIAVAAPINPAYKVGLVLVSLCPGGTTSNFISYLMKLDVSLSVALTLVNSVLIAITIPVFTGLAMNVFYGTRLVEDISVGSMVASTILLLLLPTVIGFLCRAYFPEQVGRIDKPLRVVNTVLLGTVFLGKALLPESGGGTGITAADIIKLLPWCLVLHFSSMLLSYSLSKRLVSRITATTIGVEVGLQNTTLAILVACTMLKQNEVAKPALVFALFSFFTTLAFSYLAKKASMKPSAKKIHTHAS
jgi:BASS family bile acid:Na+ symporter